MGSNGFPPGRPVPSRGRLTGLFNIDHTPIQRTLDMLSTDKVVRSERNNHDFIGRIGVTSVLNSLTVRCVPIRRVFRLLRVQEVVRARTTTVTTLHHSRTSLRGVGLTLSRFRVALAGPRTLNSLTSIGFRGRLVRTAGGHFVVRMVRGVSSLCQGTVTFSLGGGINLPTGHRRIFRRRVDVFATVGRRSRRETTGTVQIRLRGIAGGLGIGRKRKGGIPL